MTTESLYRTRIEDILPMKHTIPAPGSSTMIALLRALSIGLLSAVLLAGCGDNPDALVTAAKKEIEKKNMKAATIQLKSALQKDSNHKEARFVLGSVLRQTGDLAGAEKELRRALELGYEKNQATAALASTVFGQGKLEEFSKEFAAIELSTPDANAELKVLIGSAKLAQGKVDEAAKAFAQALALKPGFIPARIGNARIAAGKGDVAAAEKALGEILAESPKEREAIGLMATLAAVRGDRDAVLAANRKLAEYYPNGITEQYTLAVSLLEHNLIEEATKVGNRLATLAPSDPRALHVQSLNAFQRKEFTAAQEMALKALSRAPDFVPAQLVAGAAAVQLKSYGQAIQHLISVVGRQKNNAYARQLLVAAYLGAGDSVRASKELKDALEILPNDSRLLLMAGEIAAKENNMAQATKYFELSAEKGDASSMAATRLGQAHLAAGKEDEGLRILEESAKAASKGTQSDMTLVAYHLRRNQPEKALKWIESIERKQPQSALPSSLRGIALAMKNDLSGARKQFEAALQKEPGHIASLEYLARLDAKEGKTADTRRRYEDAVSKAPRSEPLALAHARLLLRQGEKMEAVIVPLRTVIKNDPSVLRARLVLIETLLRGNDPKQALAAAQEADSALPNNPAVMLWLGRSQLAAGDGNLALSTYAEAAKLQPKNPEPLMLMADAHETAGDHRAALDALKKVQVLRPDLLPVRQAQIIIHVRAKDYDSALTVAREVRQKFPKQTAGFELEAAVLVAMNRWADAAEVLQRGHKEMPSARLLVKLHGALVQSGKKDRAAVVVSEWVSKNPKDVAIRSYLAEFATIDKDFQGAIRYYKELLAAQPKNPMLLNNLAWVADQVKDPKALFYAEEANTLAPNSPAIMDTLGWMLVQRGETGRGVELLEKASKGAPQALTIRLNFARALIKAGRKSDAKKELEFLASQGDKIKEKAEVDELLKAL